MDAPQTAKKARRRTRRPRPPSSKTGSGNLETGWIVAFFGLALIAVTLAIFLPDQNPIQQFYFRIIIALAGAGIATIIPGFFEIRFLWLRNSLRAGGAIAVFAFLYFVNPPSIQLSTIPNHKVCNISGEWEYRCTALDKTFDHGGFQHGGVVTISQEDSWYGVRTKLVGYRKWRAKKEANGNVVVESVDPPFPWTVTEGSFTGPCSIQYTYAAREADALKEGRTEAKITEVNGKGVELNGTFFFYGLNPMQGTMEARRMTSPNDIKWGTQRDIR